MSARWPRFAASPFFLLASVGAGSAVEAARAAHSRTILDEWVGKGEVGLEAFVTKGFTHPAGVSFAQDNPPGPPAPDMVAPPSARRVAIAGEIVETISRHFPFWENIPDVQFETVAQEYKRDAIRADSRRRFSLATAAFLARFLNGHTRIRDTYLERNSGGPLPFSLRTVSDGWVVYDSQDPRIPDGSAVRSINGSPVEDFYLRRRPYLFASTERSARYTLFARGGMETTHLLPRRLELVLDDGRRVTVDRPESAAGAAVAGRAAYSVEGRWIEEGTVGYIRIPGFSPYEHRRRAEELVRVEFHEAQALIVDVRGAWGGATPSDLIRALMDRPWPWWTGDTLRPTPTSSSFRGELAILIDAGCVSACEDFVMPFRRSGRATVIGQATAGSSGQPAVLRFEEGIEIWVASRRQTFPDGTRFEGVGITPEVEVSPAAADFRSGADPDLTAATEILRRRLRDRR